MITPFTGRMSLTADTEAFGVNTTIINVVEGQTQSANVQLLPVNGSQRFAASDGANLSVDNVQIVDIPADAFVTPDGSAYSGSVDAEITLIDPSSDPNLMPGDYTTINDANVISLIESFGAVNITFKSSTGQTLDLEDGKTATIRIPVAEGVSNPPSTIPLFYFNESLGRWVEEGEAAITMSGGTPVYEGSVSHFTTWNADRVYETVTIRGCVVDTQGNAVANTQIRTRGSDYIGTAVARANANGDFEVAAKQTSRVFLTAISGTQSRTIVVNTVAGTQALDNCLVVDEAASTITLSWGENPDDLDTHLFGPADAAGNNLFHIDFMNKTEELGDTVLYLDVDDISSFGPEILTIPSFPFPGIYRYSVHKYSGISDINASPTRVELNLNGEISVFSPPTGTPTDCWTVFDLDVKEDGSVNILTENGGWEEDVTNCTGFPSGLASPTALRKETNLSPFKQHIKSKHYAQ